MDIIQRLAHYLKENKVKVPTISAATGIDGARIHKWLQGKANPKHDDTLLLEQFLNQENVPRGTIKPKNESDYKDKYIALLEKQCSLEETVKQGMANLEVVQQMIIATAMNVKINQRLIEMVASGKKLNFAQEAGKIAFEVSKEFSQQGIEALTGK